LRAFGAARFYRGHWKSLAIRISVGQRAFQAFAAKHDHKTMLLACFDDDMSVADLFDFGSKHRAEALASFSRDTTGTTVRDDAFGINSGKIGARANIARFQIHSKAE